MNRWFSSAVLLLLSCSSATLFAQSVSVAPVTPFPLPTPAWGTDIQITQSEPQGRPGAVGTPDGRAYVAVPDTGIMSNREIILYQSTDLGKSWSVYPQAIPGSAIVKKCKLVRTPQDSVYLFFQTDSALAYWNIATNSYYFFDTTGVADFDVAVSKSSTLHLFVQHAAHRVSRYASSNGGRQWTRTGVVSDSGASPRVSTSISGDTLIATLFTAVSTDTGRAPVTAFVYREPAPDSLQFVRRALVVDNSTKTMDHLAIMSSGVIWLFWSAEESGGARIRYVISIDGGAHYSAPYDIPAAMSAQEYWLDAGVFAQPPTGADLIFFADTVGAGKPASSGTLVFTTTTTSSPEAFFIPPEAISEHSPVWSPAGYVPTIIEFNDTTSESGVIWVGRDGAQRKIFYDRLNANTASAVSQRTDDLPLRFALAQNYPNPFNPATTIKFDLPTAGFATLKVYSILGQEVTTLVNGLLVAGTHTVQFNARTLASGVYLYRLNVVPHSPQKEGGSFSATRRMVVVK